MVHPNSLANLEKGKATRFQAGEEQVKIARKGAEESARKRAMRKTSKEIVDLIASMPIADNKILSKLEKEGFKKKDTNYLTAFWFSLYARVISKGDVPAAKLILEVLGELPDEEE